MNTISIIALTISLYGAILATYTEFIQNRKLKLKYFEWLLLRKNKTMTTVSCVEIINKSKYSIFLKQIGFEINKKELPIPRIDHNNLKEFETIDSNLFLGDGSVESTIFFPLSIKENNFNGNNIEIHSGNCISAYFDYNELKKEYKKKKNIKIRVYSIDQTGKKTFKNIPNKNIKLMLNDQNMV